MIQIDTVNRRTDPSDYWEDFDTKDFMCKTMGSERTAYIARSDSVEDVMKQADAKTFIVKKDPNLMYDHPDADVKVSVYDGYNE